MSISHLLQFQEKRLQSFTHGLRVYIFGVDVTAWLKGSVSITYGNRDSYNTAVFELTNPRKVWQLTRENLKGKWREVGGVYDESPKRAIFKNKNYAGINAKYSLVVSKTVFGSTEKNANSSTPDQAQGPDSYTAPASDEEYRYRFSVNDCIFNKHDPIRIFMRNPLREINPKTGGSEWVEVFCGFVQEHPITTNYLNGESTVRVSCYCIRQMMTKMRVNLNPLVPQTGDPSPTFDTGFFADFNKPGNRTHPFALTTLEETIKQLILGTTVTAPTQQGMLPPITGGVGGFKIGNVVCYDAEAVQRGDDNTLERWHLMTLFGVNKMAFPSGRPDDDLWLTSPQVDKIGRNTKWHPKRDVGGPDARFLHFLLPKGGTGAGNLVQYSADIAPGSKEWTTRWDIIRDFASRLDFQVLTSPSGDILVEFPLYGFAPSSFRTIPQIPFNPNKAPPSGIENLLTFEIHQKEETLNDEAEDFPSILTVTGGNSFSNTQVAGGQNGLFQPATTYIYSPVLVSRYGAISEHHDIPIAGQRSPDQGATAEKSPLSKRLSKLGLIEFMKRMADSSHWEGTLVFRPFLFPNRPIYLKRSERIGLLTSVSHNWTVGKEAGTSVALHMLMAERYDPKTEESSFRLITGALNSPIDYAGIWGENDPSAPVSGVNSDVSTNTQINPSTAPLPGQAGAPSGSGSDRPPPRRINIKDLYPDFGKLVQELIDAAAAQGMQVTLSSAYRSPEYQEYLRAHPYKDKNGRPYPVQEAFKSLHQFGLAVDLFPGSSDPAAYKRLQDINSKISQPLAWGGSYNDEVHWEIPSSWQMTTKNANEIRTKVGSDQPEKYLPAVWKSLDSIRGITGTVNNYAMEPGTTVVPVKTDAPATPQQVAQAQATPQPTDNPPPAPACHPQSLESPGLSNPPTSPNQP